LATHEHNGHRERLRQRVRKESIDNFFDYQVLEYALTFVIPYKDTNVIAHKLIAKFGSFSGVLEASEEELATIDGMGNVSAHFLSNLLKIFHYYEQDRAKKVTTIMSPAQGREYVKQFLSGKLVEEMYVVCLSASSKVVAVEKIAEGTSGEANISIRKITDKLSKTNVSSAIVAHNHPKGTAEPSKSDDKFTKALVTSLAINGCHLVDHIIIGEENEFYSYKTSGLLDQYKEEISDLIDFKGVAQPMPKYGDEYDKK
jgi:DNA repair protein RadC